METVFLLLISYFFAWCNAIYFDDAKYKKNIIIKNNFLAKTLIPKSWPAADNAKLLKNENPNLMSIFGLISYITTTIITLIWIIILIIKPTQVEYINILNIINLIILLILDKLHMHKTVKNSSALRFVFYFSYAVLFILFIIACISLFI